MYIIFKKNCRIIACNNLEFERIFDIELTVVKSTKFESLYPVNKKMLIYTYLEQ